MNYVLMYKGEAIGRTNEETSEFTLRKCEKLRNREVGWIRLDDVKADRCFGVIEGGKKNNDDDQKTA